MAALANIQILNGQEQLKAQNNKYTRVDLSTSLRFQWPFIWTGHESNEKRSRCVCTRACAFVWSVVIVTLWLHFSAPLSICSKCNLTNRKSKYFSLGFQECESVAVVCFFLLLLPFTGSSLVTELIFIFMLFNAHLYASSFHRAKPINSGIYERWM